jgi:very-short-patch-repair endonuclease
MLPGLGYLHPMYRDTNQRGFSRDLRNNPTPAEQRLWHSLKAGQLGVTFRRQAAIGPYIVDFACFPAKLIIELDGPQHLAPEAVEHDTDRTTWLASQGFRMIRFRNQELDENIQGVVSTIARAVEERPLPKNPLSPALPTKGREPNQE